MIGHHLRQGCTLCKMRRTNGLCWSRTHGIVRACEQLPPSSTPMTFDLRPGEVYYNPSGWLHSVTNLDETIMLNQWLEYDVRPQVMELV